MRAKIRDIADVQIGYQFRERPDTRSEGTHWLIQAKDIDRFWSQRLKPGDLNRVTPRRDAGDYLVRNGDVIFLSRGRRNCATWVQGLPEDAPAIAAGHFFILRPFGETILPQYLAWAINQPPAQAYLASLSRGSNIPFITKDAFASLEIDVPSVQTQECIVSAAELSLREGELLKRLEQKRAELVRGICLAAARRDTQGDADHA